MTRDEHLVWCKRRAHEYLDQGDISNAVASMLSDLNKHPETELKPGGILSALRVMTAARGDMREARRFVDGFN